MKAIPVILATGLGIVCGAATADERMNFDQHDTNNDGQLSRSEWPDAAITDVGFKRVDQDGNGQVDKQEIRHSSVSLDGAAQSRRSNSPGDKINKEAQKAFEKTDSNQDGRVSQDEAGEAGFDYVVVFYEPMDKDGNGYLDENEWNYLDANFDAWDVNDDGFVTEDEADIGWFDDNDDGLYDDDDL